LCVNKFSSTWKVLLHCFLTSIVSIKKYPSWALVAHTCNPNYSGGRNQEDHGLKPTRENSSTRHYLKKPFTKIGLVEWFKVKALSSSPSTEKKKKNSIFVPNSCFFCFVFIRHLGSANLLFSSYLENFWSLFLQFLSILLSFPIGLFFCPFI
jgi:hypothetical protein